MRWVPNPVNAVTISEKTPGGFFFMGLPSRRDVKPVSRVEIEPDAGEPRGPRGRLYNSSTAFMRP
jgi:hypothetical protein